MNQYGRNTLPNSASLPVPLRILLLYNTLTLPDDIINLQDDVKKISDWCSVWLVRLNTSADLLT